MSELVTVELLFRRGALNAGEKAGYPKGIAAAMVRNGEARWPGERSEKEVAANPEGSGSDAYALPPKWDAETWRDSTHNLSLLHEALRVRPLQEGETAYTKEEAIEVIEEALGSDDEPASDGQ